MGALVLTDPPGIVQYDEGRADFPVDKELGLDQGDLSRFLLTHSMHLVTEYSSEVSGLPGRCGQWGVRRAHWQPVWCLWRPGSELRGTTSREVPSLW